MDPERWQQIARIYEGAVEQRPELRDAYLAEMCAGDAALRLEVDALLAQDDAVVVVDRPVSQLAAELLDADVELAPGTLLGPYRVESLLGAGGMGRVYRATDTRLQRTVALKILSDMFASEPEFRERFDREAKTIAALAHPHICTLHDVGRQDGIDFLVMEHVEGETLSARLERGALSLQEALKYAVQIADALDKAHRQGIVHRDLKPANIMLTKGGAKLLDFGLAKTGAPIVVSNGAAPAQAHPRVVTAAGTILGTVQYMAPEQLEGKETDARTDVFAFGAVLYEMLTGMKAFDAKTQARLIATIMQAEPPSVSLRQPAIPPALDRVVKACLAKDPDDRWQNAADLARELRWIAEPRTTAEHSAATVAPRLSLLHNARIAWTAAAVLLFATLTLMGFAWRRTAPDTAAVRFFVSLPDGWTLLSIVTQDTGTNASSTAPLALSRDGLRIAFAARNADGKAVLWIRSLDTVEARPLAGTEGATSPFWSPDGRFLAFFADAKLKKIDITGGMPVVLCDAPNSRGGSWNPDDVIIFASARAIRRVSAAGGAAMAATDLADGEQMHLRPVFLPDGRHFLYYVLAAEAGGHAVFVGSLESNDRRRLVTADASNAVYSRGHVLFMRRTTLMAQPFDPERLALTGDAFPVAEQVQTQPSTPPLGVFAASENGVLAYQTGTGTAVSELRWFDRTGNSLNRIGEPANFAGVELSPDGRQVAVNVLDGPNGMGDIWTYDVATGQRARFTFDAASENTFKWSPDGRRIVFGSHRSSPPSLIQTLANGSGTEETLRIADAASIKGPGRQPLDWSPDGRTILFFAGEPWAVPLSGDHKPYRWGSGSETLAAAFDPTGRWVAYQSTERGNAEVFIAAFPGPGGKRQVSIASGTHPRWRRDGREIYYLAPDGTLMVAAVRSTDVEVQVGAARPLFKTSHRILPSRYGYPYDVAPDGARFLVNTSSAPRESKSAPITVAINWTTGL